MYYIYRIKKNVSNNLCKKKLSIFECNVSADILLKDFRGYFYKVVVIKQKINKKDFFKNFFALELSCSWFTLFKEYDRYINLFIFTVFLSSYLLNYYFFLISMFFNKIFKNQNVQVVNQPKNVIIIRIFVLLI